MEGLSRLIRGDVTCGIINGSCDRVSWRGPGLIKTAMRQCGDCSEARTYLEGRRESQEFGPSETAYRTDTVMVLREIGTEAEIGRVDQGDFFMAPRMGHCILDAG